MRTIRIGISGASPVAARDAGLDLLEVEKLPTLTEAKRWRAESPEALAFTLQAPRVVTRGPAGPFADDRAVRRAWKAALEVAGILEAGLIVVPTPSTFRGDDASVAALVRFFEWAHRGGIRLGWEPHGGGWSETQVGSLCRELSLTHVVDPLRRLPGRGRPPYFRLHGTHGHHHRYDEDEIQAIAAACTTGLEGRPMCDTDRVFCVFRNGARLDDARRLAARIRGTA